MEYVVLVIALLAVACFVGCYIYEEDTLFGMGCMLVAIVTMLVYTLYFY